jgi:hypothetical protein
VVYFHCEPSHFLLPLKMVTVIYAETLKQSSTSDATKPKSRRYVLSVLKNLVVVDRLRSGTWSNPLFDARIVGYVGYRRVFVAVDH